MKIKFIGIVMLRKIRLFIITLIILLGEFCNTQNADSLYIAANYVKHEFQIPMRDGIKLFTSVYIPKDTTQMYPILLHRTPYTVAPYGTSNFPNVIGPSMQCVREGFIFVEQDVRGKFMSEGNFVNMTPYIHDKVEKTQIDESSDAFDTIEWLLKNISLNNGKVGVWGVSYPGFYAVMSSINSHPNLVAVSPQAPIADWFVGDDMHHNGALTLSMAYNFFSFFGRPQQNNTKFWPLAIPYDSPDAYNFFLKLGPIKNVKEKYFGDSISFWNDIVSNGTYNNFWKTRNTLPHLKNIKPAILIVGGWYDSEDLYGTLQTYKTIEKNNPGIKNSIIMGPWFHHAWAYVSGENFGDISFGSKTAEFYRDSVEFPFFNYFLKGKGELRIPEALMFETGSNKWNYFTEYPPQNSEKKKIFINEFGKLSFEKPINQEDKFDEYISDPNKPVPYTSRFQDSRSLYNRFYPNEDQRFASCRPDVLVFESEPLDDDFSIIGPIEAELFVSTTGTDADWVVKLIDVYPEGEKNLNSNQIEMGGYQQLVRGEIMRGKFRNSYESPQPFIPSEVTKVKIILQDVNHRFLKRHKIMVQIQSSWFPLFDRNPQKFCDIYNANEKDFQKQYHRVYFSQKYSSHIQVNVLLK
jgi:hypothetical protein